MTDQMLSEKTADRPRPAETNLPEPKNKSVAIVVISLPQATRRRRGIEAVFRDSGLAWNFFDAHTSLQQPGLRYEADNIQKLFGRTLSRSEIAICSSHVAVLQDFVDRGTTEHILVLEDDVIFDVDFPLDHFASFCADNGMHYIRLFGKHYAHAVKLGFYFDRSIVRFTTTPAGAQAYLMSREGARRFLQTFQTIDAALDLAMDKFWITQLPIFAICPYPVIERYSPSSNPMPQTDTAAKGFDGLVWLRNRALGKLRKIVANFALRGHDRSLQRKRWYFRQIFDSTSFGSER
jgi:GR25 family glycosyltransferase involved in LPS biosynthesis